MKLLKENKILLYCLLVYLLGQVLVWYVYNNTLERIVLIVHELAYIIAIIVGCWLLIRKSSINKLKLWLNILLLFFLVNLLLFVYWIFKVYLNPDINWELQGNEYEVDPWYIILYLPVINFGIAFLLVSLAFLYTFFTSKPLIEKNR